MKYIVVQNLIVTLELEPGGEEGTDIENSLVFCDTTQEVHDAIQAIGAKAMREHADSDWSVFEVVNGKPVQRAVVFKHDGPVSYDVEIAGG